MDKIETDQLAKAVAEALRNALTPPPPTAEQIAAKHASDLEIALRTPTNRLTPEQAELLRVETARLYSQL